MAREWRGSGAGVAREWRGSGAGAAIRIVSSSLFQLSLTFRTAAHNQLGGHSLA